MPFVKGSRHSEETRAKMSAARLGKPHSEERKARIAAANQGRVFAKKYQRVCVCGAAFASAASNSKYCSRRCLRASFGHGLLHAPSFAAFPRLCAICSATEQLVGDHDHATGAPRGVLCRPCNLAIGNMRDDPRRLRAAAAYLER